MAAIARQALETPADRPHGDPWPALAAQARRWALAQGVVLRDAVVLLPFAQLLPLAQQAFAAGEGWVPRVETTQTLARALGPVAARQPLDLCFDAATDHLTAARLLRTQAQGSAWAQRDPRGFAGAVALLVQTASALARAAAAVPPPLRPLHWEQGRQLIAPVPGPGARERWLARVALEWAAQAPTPATDRLWTHRPAAWIVLQAGGADALAEALIAQAADDTPVLVIDADSAPSLPAAPPSHAVCEGFEQEAQRAAALVLDHCAAGRVPVALVGQDRLLVRRVRALLERAGVQPQDETGWTLPTTRAAALVMGLLRAADPLARSDELFDALKSLPPGAWLPLARLEALEQACRREGLARVADLARLPAGAGESETATAVRGLLAAIGDPARPLAAWLVDLRGVLVATGAWPALQADAAGQAVLRALRLAGESQDDLAWRDASAVATATLPEFVAWVDAGLEGATFQPPAGRAEVAIVPMTQLPMRAFAAVVWPGADERQLGAPPAPHPLLEPAALRALGLPDAAAQRRRERLLFAQALRLPRVSFLRRHSEGGEPLVDSPLLEALRLDLAERGVPLPEAADPRRDQVLAPMPMFRPAPSAPGLLPERLSASAAEALRECPYRFHARHQLRLREDEELDDAVEKRDYGNWLHAVLWRFHQERGAPGASEAEVARLLAIADDERVRRGLAEELALPYVASLQDLAPRYLAWLHARDAEGTHWQAGEQEHRVELPGIDGVQLQGVIDRIDRRRDGTLELLDYKTGSASALKRKVDHPLEDTQLAFYAALLDPSGDRPLAAAYLPLDQREAIKPLEHREVGRSAAILLHALGSELARVRAGAPLPALGEGSTCEHCEARGLCRRDDWSEA